MIWGDVLGSKIDEKSVLGGLLGPRPILDVQKVSEAFVLGGQVGAFLGLSRFLATSWSLKKRLEASRGGLEPLFFRAKFQAYFGPHFASILTPACPQNLLKINQQSVPTGTLKRRLISKPLASKIQDDLTLKLKRPMYKNYKKNSVFFCTFFTS